MTELNAENMGEFNIGAELPNDNEVQAYLDGK